MIIKINLNNVSINSRIDFLDEKSNLLYWSIYDFSYKRRMRLFDNKDNELGYVNLKIESLNNVETIYDKQDNKLDEFDETILKGDIKSYDFNVEDVVFTKKDDELLIQFEDDKVYKAILYALISIDKNEKE